MIISHLILRNWRNFASVDVPLRDRMFIVGPNASGKSNFLDVFRFLRDVAKEGGGLQYAISERGGLSKIRCLAARKYPDVEIVIQLLDNQTDANPITWKYGIGITQDNNRNAILTYERVWRTNQQILNRPNPDDKSDPERLRQTHLQQVTTNNEFREIAKALRSVTYLHLVPQLLRYPKAFFGGQEVAGDPFGKDFLVRIARTQKRTRHSRLKKIETALKKAVPQLKQLTDVIDEAGVPHLEAIYQHWRPHGARQREDQFSDGTLRLIGLLWSLLEGDSLLLLEEPELSLNSAIVSKLPAIIYKLQRSRKRQVLVSTHSSDLLQDKSIGGESVLLLQPDKEGTKASIAASIAQIRDLLDSGLSVADATLPFTKPRAIGSFTLAE